jgi:long-chain acyl-CoA synthetase
MSDLHPGTHAAAHPDRVAIRMGWAGTEMTYGELDAWANRASRVFRSLGLRPGDHVAFCLENRPEFLALAWGAHYAGLYYTAVSTRLTADELAYIVDDCGARAVVVSPYRAATVADLPGRCHGVDAWYSLGGPTDGYEPFEDALAAEPAEPLADRVEGADMLYSSGTTGRPKGVKVPLPGAPLGTANALVNLAAFLFGMDETTVYLSPAPLYHAAPLRFCMSVLRLGGTVVVMEHFDPEEALVLIERCGVTHSQWVPTMFVRMLKLPERTRARFDLSTLRFAVHAAAPCPIEVKRAMFDWWGPVIHEYYAGTEGNGFVYCGPEDWLAHPGTVGRPLLGTIHIVGDDGSELPPGEEGTVYFSGGGSFQYHNDPATTAESHLGNGWSTLGDVGRLDEDGFLHLTDRRAYMIITGGVNVYPQEAENVLTMHPEVLDVAVIGVPNEDFGEEVKAVVQLVDPSRASPALAAELIAHCRERLADVKCPRSIDFRDELPRHPTGKLYKRLLRDEYWSGQGRRI